MICLKARSTKNRTRGQGVEASDSDIGGATAGSSRAFRLDPHSLPARAPAPTTAQRPSSIDAIARSSGGSSARGDDVRLVPITAYRGVAVRMEADGEAGSVRVFVELLHSDPTLTVPLSSPTSPTTSPPTGRRGARAQPAAPRRSPPDGTVSAPLATIGGAGRAPPKPRRRHVVLRARAARGSSPAQDRARRGTAGRSPAARSSPRR